MQILWGIRRNILGDFNKTPYKLLGDYQIFFYNFKAHLSTKIKDNKPQNHKKYFTKKCLIPVTLATYKNACDQEV